MKYLYLFILFPGFILGSCGHTPQRSEETPGRAAQLIDSAIAYHGGDAYYNADISFGFRSKLFHVRLDDSGFTYRVGFTDSLGRHESVLTGEGYRSTLNAQPEILTAKDSTAAANSLNSVVYFALLPRFLTDKAVHPRYIGIDSLNGKTYEQIEVTFAREGGGQDFQDTYLYWFDTTDHSMDYLAYSFIENGGGSRFRVARNSRRVNGIVFQDYDNFKGPSPDSLSYVSEMFRNGNLTKLSEINLDRLRVIREN